jgi:hypothetical protein
MEERLGQERNRNLAAQFSGYRYSVACSTHFLQFCTCANAKWADNHLITAWIKIEGEVLGHT